MPKQKKKSLQVFLQSQFFMGAKQDQMASMYLCIMQNAERGKFRCVAALGYKGLIYKRHWRQWQKRNAEINQTAI